MAPGYQAAHPGPSRVTGQRPIKSEALSPILQQYMDIKVKESVSLLVSYQNCVLIYCASGLKFLPEPGRLESVVWQTQLKYRGLSTWQKILGTKNK